ncbi:unnamed protein product [Bursaphelenchus okinawaensis]|uniref:Non-specific serine/threonine protein kinase n=1 Tax=Bursaphelenchus okinawaensis TaxID=465554 RepID=A0A811JTE9_9BILA|nr:unnamed protein product [Bursaphelenchus okinawaensis]CAG9082319.1 unnamed protein product [Bursaphelenchus okinawaensis]
MTDEAFGSVMDKLSLNGTVEDSLRGKLEEYDDDNILQRSEMTLSDVLQYYKHYSTVREVTELVPELLNCVLQDSSTFLQLSALIIEEGAAVSLQHLLLYLQSNAKDLGVTVGHLLFETRLIGVVIGELGLKYVALMTKVVIQVFEGQSRGNVQEIYIMLTKRILTIIKGLNTSRDKKNTVRELQMITSSLCYFCVSQNLFMVMTLSPGLLEFFLNLIPVDDEHFIVQYSALHLQCLCLAFNFCRTHNYFIATSKMAQKSLIEAPSSGFLQLQFKKLGSILSHYKVLSTATLDLCLEWMFLIVNQVNFEIMNVEETILLKKSIVNIFLEGLDGKQSRSNRLVDGLKVFELLSEYDDEELRVVMSKIFARRHDFLMVFKMVPADTLLRYFLQPESVKVDDLVFTNGDNGTCLTKLFMHHGDKKMQFVCEVQQAIRRMVTEDTVADFNDSTVYKLVKSVNDNMTSILRSRVKYDIGRGYLIGHSLLELVEQTEKNYGSCVEKADNSYLTVFDVSFDVLCLLFECALDIGRPHFVIRTVTEYSKGQDIDHDIFRTMSIYVVWAYLLLRDVEGVTDVEVMFLRKYDHRSKCFEVYKEFAMGRVELCLNLVDVLDYNDIDSNPVVYKLLNWIRHECLEMVPVPLIRRQLAPNAFHGLVEVNENLDSNILMGLVGWNLPEEPAPVVPIHKMVQSVESDVKQLLQSWLTKDQFYADPMFFTKSIQDIEGRLSSLVQLSYSNHEKPAWRASLDSLQTLFKILESKTEWQSAMDSLIDNTKLDRLDVNYLFKFGQNLGNYFEKTGAVQLCPTSRFHLFLSSLALKSGNQMLFYHYNDKSLKMNNQRLYPTTQMKYLSKRVQIGDCDKAVPQYVVSDGTKLYSLLAQNLEEEVDLVADVSNRLATLSQHLPLFCNAIKSQTMPTKIQNSALEVLPLSTKSETAYISGAFHHLATILKPDSQRFSQDFRRWMFSQIKHDNGNLRLTDSEFNDFKRILQKNDVKMSDEVVTVMEATDSYETMIEILGKKSNSDVSGLLSNVGFNSTFSLFKQRQKMQFDVYINILCKLLLMDNTVNIVNVSACLEILEWLLCHPMWMKEHETRFLETSKATSWLSVIPQMLGILKQNNEDAALLMKQFLIPLILENPHKFAYYLNNEHNTVHDEYLINDNNVDEDGISLGISVYQEIKEEEKSSFEHVADQFKSVYPDLTEEVLYFSAEFDQISLTLSERWNYLLSHLNTDINSFNKSIKGYSQQLEKVLDHRSHVKLVVAELAKNFRHTVLQLITEFYEETEFMENDVVDVKRFKACFMNQIGKALRESAQASSVNKFFTPFVDFMSKLHSDIQRQDNQILNLNSLSPGLAKLRGTGLPLPGLKQHEDRTIYSIDSAVYVLPTKTRPKKVTVIDDAGERHTYLCKGQEDLKLDERVSGLFALSNQLFLEQTTKKYCCRQYSVTPLSNRTGLVEWVSSAKSVYQIYKTWYYNQLENKLLKRQKEESQDSQNDADSEDRSDRASNSAVNDQSLEEREHDYKEDDRHFRPVKTFYSVMKDIMGNQQNVNYKNRSLWTEEMLLKSFNKMKETAPHHLISEYIWKSSTTSAEWYTKINNYTKSMAAANMMGSLIDLGDRHLDNILVDHSTGELVHVDFNVCFHKGAVLRVPERVPFRLTQAFLDVLGPAESAGKFTVFSEEVLQCLSNNKNLIRNYLNVFQSDPLTEWSIPNDPITGSKLNMFGSIVTHNDSLVLNLLLTNFCALLGSLKPALQAVETKIAESIRSLIDQGTTDVNVEIFHRYTKKHQAIMHRLKPFLKILAVCIPEFKAFVTVYKTNFSSPMAKILRIIVGQSDSSIQGLLNDVMDNIHTIFGSLYKLQEVHVIFDKERILCPSSRYSQRLKTTLVNKLNGCEAENERLTVSQHVQYLINAATNDSNLSQMYEGWMPWM